MLEKRYFYDTVAVVNFLFKGYEDDEYSPKKIRQKQTEFTIKMIVTPLIIEEVCHIYFALKKADSSFKDITLDFILTKLDENFLLESGISNDTESIYGDYCSMLKYLNSNTPITFENGHYNTAGPKDILHLAEAKNKNCSLFITFDGGIRKAHDILKEEYPLPDIIYLRSKTKSITLEPQKKS